VPGGSRRYHKIHYAPEKIDSLLCDLFIESHTVMPDQIVLDLDGTDIPLYGHQPERFFHGYYDSPYTLLFPHSGQRSPWVRFWCLIATFRAPLKASAPLRPRPGVGGVLSASCCPVSEPSRFR